MTYEKQVEYARYTGENFRDLAKGRVYKIIIRERKSNWLENLFIDSSKHPRFKVCRWADGRGVQTCINYAEVDHFNADWRMEPNWLQMSQNRRKKKGGKR